MTTVPAAKRGTALAARADGLAAWAEASGSRWASGQVHGGLRFAFYGRVSTEDWQDPVTSRARQREQAEALVREHGHIVAEFFDEGQSRTVAWGRRPQAAAVIGLLADPTAGGTRCQAAVIGQGPQQVLALPPALERAEDRPVGLDALSAAPLQSVKDLGDHQPGQAPQADHAALRHRGLSAAPLPGVQAGALPGRMEPPGGMGPAEQRRAAVSQPRAGQHLARPESRQRGHAWPGQELLDRHLEHHTLLVDMRSAKRSPARLPRPRAAHCAPAHAGAERLRALSGNLSSPGAVHVTDARTADVRRPPA